MPSPSNPKLNNNNAVKIISNDNNNRDRNGNKIEVKQIVRPQSAKVGSNPIPNNDLNNKIHQINNINNQLIRKNLSSDRPSDNNKVVNRINNNLVQNIKKPVIGNSPRTRSPPKEKLININNNILIRPSSGKSNNSGNNNPVILRNDKKVIIEKINFDKAILQNPVRIIDKKQNYHYNMNQNVGGNKNVNNFMNNVKVDNNRGGGVVNNQYGPKIVNINQRK
jgi:hypothetical protein